MADQAPLLSPVSIDNNQNTTDTKSNSNTRIRQGKSCSEICNRPNIRYSLFGLLGIIVSLSLFALKSKLPWFGHDNSGGSDGSGSDSSSSNNDEGSSFELLSDHVLALESMSETLLKGSLTKGESVTNFFVDTVSRTLSFDQSGSSLSVSQTDKGLAYSWSDGTASSGGAGSTLDDVESYDNWSKFLKSSLSTQALNVGFKMLEEGHYGTHSNALRTFHMSLKIIAKQKTEVMTEGELKDYQQLLSDAKGLQSSVDSKSLYHNRRMLQITMYRECEDCSCEMVDTTQSNSNCTGSSNECLGMCGLDCNCWWWVCGDCDCNCICYEHDQYCSCVSLLHPKCWGLLLAFEACC